MAYSATVNAVAAARNVTADWYRSTTNAPPHAASSANDKVVPTARTRPGVIGRSAAATASGWRACPLRP